jgi:glucokinase
MDLIADIGATNGRFGLVDEAGDTLAPQYFKLADFDGIESLIRAYVQERGARIDRAVLAVAAPVVGDEVVMVNRGWRFRQSELRRAFAFSQLERITDFAAIAWALPKLMPRHVTQIGGGDLVAEAPRAALGPGSGLGCSSVVRCADGWAVAQGEGGHVTLPAMTDEESRVIDLIRDELGHCSAERVLSGPGLVRLHQALSQLEGREAQDLTPIGVTTLAAEGEPLAVKTREMFFAMLGTVAGDLALTLGARGGVYIAGGIVPRLVDAFDASGFRARFEQKGRYQWYMHGIPTYVITDPLPAFIGLRRKLGYE